MTPENTHRYSENVMASTNFTVSENITKDSSIGSDILDRVITDLLANFDEKFELEKGLWDIDDYIVKLKIELNNFHNNFNWNNSNGSYNCQYSSNSRSDYSELQRKTKMNEAIRKKMEGTLKTNTNERESITNLFKYVVRDQKKEFQNLKNQSKQHLNDKENLQNHIKKLETEVNCKNIEVSCLFKQLEEKDKLFKQLESNNATIQYYQQIIQKFIQMDTENTTNCDKNQKSCTCCSQDKKYETKDKLLKNFKFPDKKQMANYYNKSAYSIFDHKKNNNNQVVHNNMTLPNNYTNQNNNQQKVMVSNTFSNTNSRNVLRRKSSMFTYVTNKDNNSDNNSGVDMNKSHKNLNDFSENVVHQNGLNFDTKFASERVSSRILTNEATISNQAKKEIMMNNIKKNNLKKQLSSQSTNRQGDLIHKQLSAQTQSNNRQSDYNSKTVFLNKENHNGYNNNQNAHDHKISDAALYEKNAERMHNNLLQNNYLSSRNLKNNYTTNVINPSSESSQKYRLNQGMLVDSQQLSLLKSSKGFNEHLNNNSSDFNPQGYNQEITQNNNKPNVFYTMAHGTEKPGIFIRDIENNRQEVHHNEIHKNERIGGQDHENKKEMISKLDRSKSAPNIN